MLFRSDLANCQLDPVYLRSLQRYNKVLLQRNRLLRLIGERRAEPDQLDFWDGELAQAGSYLMLQRHLMVAELDRLVQPIHHQLTTGKEELSIAYLPSIELKSDGLDALSSDFRQRLRDLRRKEVMQGMSLAGPHRDDLRFSIHDVDMNVFASRGQQRTIALSLKLAEARFMHSRMDDHPVILLDDVLSELDPVRCHQLLEAITSYEQVVITATDLDRFDPHFLAQATLFAVREGEIGPA